MLLIVAKIANVSGFEKVQESLYTWDNNDKITVLTLGTVAVTDEGVYTCKVDMNTTMLSRDMTLNVISMLFSLSL